MLYYYTVTLHQFWFVPNRTKPTTPTNKNDLEQRCRIPQMSSSAAVSVISKVSFVEHRNESRKSGNMQKKRTETHARIRVRCMPGTVRRTNHDNKGSSTAGKKSLERHVECRPGETVPFPIVRAKNSIAQKCADRMATLQVLQ